jgi:hypothetical protein
MVNGIAGIAHPAGGSLAEATIFLFVTEKIYENCTTCSGPENCLSTSKDPRGII